MGNKYVNSNGICIANGFGIYIYIKNGEHNNTIQFHYVMCTILTIMQYTHDLTRSVSISTLNIVFPSKQNFREENPNLVGGDKVCF